MFGKVIINMSKKLKKKLICRDKFYLQNKLIIRDKNIYWANFFYLYLRFYVVLHPLQNINKSWSKNFNIFGLNFELNTSSFFDSLLFIFCNGRSINFQRRYLKKINSKKLVFTSSWSIDHTQIFKSIFLYLYKLMALM
jgi:hypothetical protein